MTGELTPRPGESSADFKLRIEKAQAEVAAQRRANPPPPPTVQVPAPTPKAPEAKAPESAPATPPPPQPKPSATQTPSAPSAQPPAEPAKPAAAVAPTPEPKGEDKVDHLEWAKKKGLKSPEDIARSLRSLETEFHRRNTQGQWGQPAPNAQSAPQEPPRPPVPSYVPPMPPPYQPRPDAGYPPAYQPRPTLPPAPVPLRRDQLQWISDTYQIPLEDAERLAPMVMDMVAGVQRAQDQRFQRLERDNARNNEMWRLMQDPSFQNPEVQFEMHRILEQNPRIFEVEPAPYTVAFNQALLNIARLKLANAPDPQPNVEVNPLPTRPPSTLGSDGGVSGKPAGDGTISVEQFGALPVDKKREMLTAIGARPRA